MIKYCKITLSALILTSSFILFTRLDLNAAVLSKEDAVNTALAQARVQDEAAVTPQENPELKYRQTLKEAITEKPEEFKMELDTYSRFIPSTGAKCQSGSVSVFDNEAEYSYDFKAFGKLPVALALATQYIGINNSTAVGLPTRLTGVNFGIETTLPFFNVKNTYFRVGVAPSFYGDNWNITSGNFRLPSRAFWIYQPNEKLTIIGGVAINVDYSEAFSPIVGFIYEPNDKLTFNLIPTRPNITYEITDKLSVLAEAGFSSGEFLVNKDGQKNTKLTYNEYHGGLGLSYDINKNINASLVGGMVMGRSLKYTPDSLGKVSIKNSPYVEFRVKVGM
ncbi:MAG: DUF6268 family outer membrane beta-barrel protein [Candidatus Omnitrophica bacterium]|nr:DUF6268 family outer membrane beta-barrel protein [Candidatus Omnitrophota bacterium]